ncbi:hypothetical protein [Alicyclobacillus dauci]|uniref:Uncharacterized protein n=1 Tax=Alicyclobacillus dauci TaxID=1475485 RepID=A0ABY6YWW2_9BACL|nr:hypothetical protein [Alicyclobacillus dauci]WAH35037.1 hypothetical protein NZD86_11925 [Alicyclobacillus dauci]
MSRTESATAIITAMIEAGAFQLGSAETPDAKTERVASAFQKIYQAVEQSEHKRISAPIEVK